jgi:hypothetical protein
MSVLNPLLAFTLYREKPFAVDLLTTREERSKSLAKTIIKFLTASERFHFESSQFVTREISDSLDWDDYGRPPAHKIIREISDLGDIAFNLAGGMNFQIAACVYEIPLEKCIYLYPEAVGVHAWQFQDSSPTYYDLYPLPNPVDVLSLQGIHSERGVSRSISGFFKREFEKAGITLSKRGMMPVRIGDVLFEHSWNHGNELRFMKIIHKQIGDEKNDKFYLRESRKIISLASKRDAFGELYHRRIGVLTNIPTVAERLKEEGGGKIQVIEIKYDRSSSQNALQESLRNFFHHPTMTSINESGISIHNDSLSNITRETMLYIAFGRNLMPTCIGLWTHKPSKVCLLYTPSDPEVQRIKNAFMEYKNLLPTREIQFIPISIEGVEILDLFNGSEPDKTEVNITPGTKGHTTFLTLWSKLHEVKKIYSIETKSQKLIDIITGDACPLKGPSPCEYLLLSGKVIKETGADAKKLQGNSKRYNEVINFMRQMLKEKGNINDFPFKNIDLQNACYRVDKRCGEIISKGKQQNKTKWSLVNSTWFEELIGYCSLKSGADDVQVRIRTPHEHQIEEHLREKYPDGNIFLTDIDLCVRFNANYYVISCKATQREKSEVTAEEVVAMANHFGRFAVPLISFLKYGGDPFKTKNGVFCFGYKTFMNFEALNGLFKIAISEVQKTV